jgi:hypothetical protein
VVVEWLPVVSTDQQLRVGLINPFGKWTFLVSVALPRTKWYKCLVGFMLLVTVAGTVIAMDMDNVEPMPMRGM